MQIYLQFVNGLLDVREVDVIYSRTWKECFHVLWVPTYIFYSIIETWGTPNYLAICSKFLKVTVILTLELDVSGKWEWTFAEN
jgi:hypothetical protein